MSCSPINLKGHKLGTGIIKVVMSNKFNLGYCSQKFVQLFSIKTKYILKCGKVFAERIAKHLGKDLFGN